MYDSDADFKLWACFQEARSAEKIGKLDDDGVVCGYFNASLLRVSRVMRREAAPILYGQDTFFFYGPYPWHNFFYFVLRLTDINRFNIRKVDMSYPRLRRSIDSKDGSVYVWFDDAVRAGLHIMKGLTYLEILRFGRCSDIFTHDLGVLRQVREIQEGSNMKFRVVLASGNPTALECMHEFCIGRAAEESIRGWGWKLRGTVRPFLANQNHSDEAEWMESLIVRRRFHQTWERNRSGLRKEPSIFKRLGYI